MGLFKKLFLRNTLYYPGCLIKHVAIDLNDNYKEILKKLGIEFLEFEDFVCCGSPVLNAGYTEDFENLMTKNTALLDVYGIKTIITPCPACLKMLKKDYGLEEKGIKVKHVTEVLAENIHKFKELKELVKNPVKVTFHDPCHLGRHCGIYNEPRKLIMKIGYQLEEFDKKMNDAECCGGGGGVKANFPEIANEIAKKRIKNCKTKLLVTACPLCYLHLKENSSGIDVKEISQILKEAL
ncbi:MAG: (Fe-S)-binding protein [Candidatus Pacearchaeota archaeon]